MAGVALGNPCRVDIFTESESPLIPESGEFPYCATWRETSRGREERAQVKCWTHQGSPIQLCGHGLLCAVAAWSQFDPNVVELEMNGLPIAFRIEDDLAWIGLPTVPCDACAVPFWVREFFQDVPWRAAIAGGDNGYLVLEWPADFDLERLSVPSESLAAFTQRSIVATSAAQTWPEYDVLLRYFAANHGVPEDTATGSAMRVLASYWMRRELNGELAARQCSTLGGELFSRLRENLTWIGGRVINLSTEGRHAA